MKVQAESFHLNGHIIGFRPHTQKLESPYKIPSSILAVKGLKHTIILFVGHSRILHKHCHCHWKILEFPTKSIMVCYGIFWSGQLQSKHKASTKVSPVFLSNRLKKYTNTTKTEINDASMEIRKNRFLSLCFLVNLAQIEPERAKIGHYEMCHKLMNSIYERIKAVCAVRE